MKKKKLQLKDLKVKSFVTTLNTDELEEVQGGFLFRTRANNLFNIGGSKGKPIMTVTEQRKDENGYLTGSTIGGVKP